MDQRIEVVLHFKTPITELKQSVGLVSNIKWMWLFSPFISFILTFIDIAVVSTAKYMYERIVGVKHHLEKYDIDISDLKLPEEQTKLLRKLKEEL